MCILPCVKQDDFHKLINTIKGVLDTIHYSGSHDTLSLAKEIANFEKALAMVSSYCSCHMRCVVSIITEEMVD